MPSSRGIFLTQRSNPRLLHWHAGSLPLAPGTCKCQEQARMQRFLATEINFQDFHRDLEPGTEVGTGNSMVNTMDKTQTLPMELRDSRTL